MKGFCLLFLVLILTVVPISCGPDFRSSGAKEFRLLLCLYEAFA